MDDDMEAPDAIERSRVQLIESEVTAKNQPRIAIFEVETANDLPSRIEAAGTDVHARIIAGFEKADQGCPGLKRTAADFEQPMFGSKTELAEGPRLDIAIDSPCAGRPA
jgi:hypothetical protein